MELSRKRKRDIFDSAIDKPLAAAPKGDLDGPKLAPSSSRTLFVRSLPPTITEDALIEHFSETYPVRHATIVQNADGTPKGFGFVTFIDAAHAIAAAKEFDNSRLGDKKIRVEIAAPRQRTKDGKPGQLLESVIKQKEEREQQRTQPTPKLIVRNLPWTVKTSEQLSKLFMPYGKIRTATLPKNESGMLRGFGFVVLRGKKNSEKALEGLNGSELDGRTLAVDWAVQKEAWDEANKEDTDNDVEMEDADVEDEDLAVDDDETSQDEVDLDAEDESHISDEALDEEDEDEDEEDHHSNDQYRGSTIFIRNLPWSATDDSLYEHFSTFGPVRYARVVMDHNTGRPRGTAFVSFYNQENSETCLKEAPKQQQREQENAKNNIPMAKHSVLQSEDADPTGKYTMEGRLLQISAAVDRQQAAVLSSHGLDSRLDAQKDKRRLYLLSEGTISAGSQLHSMIASSEITLRESSLKQRKALIASNPSLRLSLTRLSIRNIPRSVTDKDLKALARKAVVEFATDVKNGNRQPLNKEELSRDGTNKEQKVAERKRKMRGGGIVKQSKVIFESKAGSKTSSAHGRSRGYGFLEFASHRWALMGLRGLNGRLIDNPSNEDKKRRLIVEFAIENAAVVARRNETQDAARRSAEKRKKLNSGAPNGVKEVEPETENDTGEKTREEKIAKRNQIIGRKRAARKAKRKA